MPKIAGFNILLTSFSGSWRKATSTDDLARPSDATASYLSAYCSSEHFFPKKSYFPISIIS